MPSTIADFRTSTRRLRPSLQANLGAGLVERRSNLKDFTIFSTLNGSLTGVFDKIFDARLKYSVPDATWAKPGLEVTASLSVSNDDFATSYTENLFSGYTIRQNSVPQDDVQIRANSKNSIYLDRVLPAKKLYQNQDLIAIVTDILTSVGVSPSDILLTSSGYIIPAYTVSNNLTARYYINDLCKLGLYVMGFNRNNKFVASSTVPLTFGSTSFTPAETFALSNIKKFKNREIQSKNYANRIVIRGEKRRAVVDSTLYFNTQLQYLSIAPGETLYYVNELQGVDPVSIKDLTPYSSSFEPTNIYSYKPTNTSRYTFYTADDGTGTKDNSNISLLSQSLAWDDSKKKDVYFATFKNNSLTQTYYLKYVELIGTGTVTESAVFVEDNNESRFVLDGGVIEYALESRAVQASSTAENMLNLLKLNLYSYASVYTFEAQGRPNLEVGDCIQITDRSGVIHQLILQEIDLEVTTDGAVMAIYTAKKIPASVDWLDLDTSPDALDSATYTLF